MKTGITLLIIGLVIAGIDIRNYIVGEYRYEKNFECYWHLAEKASTIAKKTEGIDKFIKALESSNMRGKYNAVFLETPDNSFEMNLDALKSLQLRLHEIEKMDVASFQYQTAIQQITAQEQGEALKMLRVFSGVWWKENYITMWQWVLVLNILMVCILLITGFAYIMLNADI